MATYIPVATDGTQPTDDVKASTMGLEFRTLKSYIQATIVAQLTANTAGLAGKANRAGDTFTGHIAIATASGDSSVAISRVSQSAGAVVLYLVGGSGGRNYSLYQPVSSDALYLADGVNGSRMIFQANGVNKSLGSFQAPNYGIGDEGVGNGGTLGFITANGPYMQFFGNSYGSGVSGYTRWGRHGLGNQMDLTAAGALILHVGSVTAAGGFIGNASTASVVPWTGVSGRPTHLSQFVNDIGAGGGGITSFQGRTAAAAVLISADVTGALGFTPYNASNPSNYASLAQVAAAGYQTGSGHVATATTATNATNATNQSGGSVSASVVVSGSSITAVGRVEGNGGAGNGLGKITVSTSAPSGGAQGDIWFQY